jgi:hypothetical protein
MVSKTELLEALRGMVNIATHPKATKAQIRQIAKEAREVIRKSCQSTTSHAPGPWQYNGYDDHCGTGRRYHEITDSDGFEVVNQNGVIGTANARLIATAPELLSVCTWIAEYLAEHEEWTREHFCMYEDSAESEWVDMLHTTIRKATGE